jgi:YfiH family protein
MPFEQTCQIRYFTFDLFQTAPIVHGVFTRHGGVSPEPWASLNLGGTVGDERSCVIENRRRVFAAVNLPVESIHDVWQVHSDRVVTARVPRPLDQEHEKADAIITDKRDVTLLMRFADCVPILLYDPVRHVTGIVHAGWKGTVMKIAMVTVAEMQRVFGCNPADVLAGIGPSIGPKEYEIGTDVVEQVRCAFPDSADTLLWKVNAHFHFDLWEANKLALTEAGVGHVEIARISTAVNTKDWYSHRAEKGRTGRFGALIALK